MLVGFMGAGKSTVGPLLADRLQMRFVDTDELVERQTASTIAEIFERDGEEAFRAVEHRAVRQAIRYGGRVIACGGGAILELRNHDALRSAGPIVYLKASARVLRDRLQGSADARPLLRAQGAFEKLLLARERAYASAADLTVNADAEPEEIVEQIVKGLR